MELKLDHIKIVITKTKKKIRKILKTIIIAAIVVAVIIIFLSGLALANKGKIVRGLKIAGISVGGLSVDNAQIRINETVEKFFEKDVVLRHEDEKDVEIWTALSEEMGMKINIGPTLARASKIGHQGKLFFDLSQQILAFLGYYNPGLSFQVDEEKLETFIREKLNSIDRPAIDAGLRYNEETDNFVQVPGRQGMIIDRGDLKLKLQEKMEKLTQDDIYLNLIYDSPEILEEETYQAHIKAKVISANAPYKLTANSAQIIFTKEEVIPLIEFRPVSDKSNPENKILGITLSSKGLNNYLAALGPSINRKAVNAQLTIERDRVTNFALSQDGLELGIKKNIQKLREEILNKGNKEIELEVSIVPPKTATKDIDNLGITTLIEKGVSNFAGSPSSRIHNIKLGAATFHGVLLKPGEEFSFNTILGEVGPEQGYKPELVIKKDKTIPEYGGGLCQVSTTTFRAAVNSGLPVIERAPHAFPVVYYNPQGFDATIYPPHPDLRFTNNTPGHLLIQTEIDGHYLIFEFYGTNDGRKIELDGPRQYDIKSDGSMKAELTRKIYKNDELIEEKTWYSNYKSPSLYPVQRNPLE